MRKFVLLVAQCLLLAGCTGLPRPREMGDMALLQVVGVDGGGSVVTLTVSTGERTGGGEGGSSPPMVLTASGTSLAAAGAQLGQMGSERPFFGCADKLLLGPQARVGEVLNWLSHDDELSLGVKVWLLDGLPARQAVEGEGVEKRLSALEQGEKLATAPMTRTAGEIYAALLDQNCAFLPILAGDGELDPTGYALLVGEAVVGLLTGEEARGLEFLCEQPLGAVLEAPLPGNQVSVRITGAQLDCKPRFEGGQLQKLELRCRVSAELCRWERPLTAPEREAVAAEGGRQIGEKITAALNRLQGAGADCVGLGSRVAIAAPRYWESARERWPEIFAAARWELDVHVSLD